MAVTSIEQLVEQIGSLSLLEAAELVKELKSKFGIGDMPMAAAPAAGAAVPVEVAAGKAEYKVTLKEAGAKKIDVIKVVKKITNWGSTEAKKAVEEAPQKVIMESMPKADAEKLKKELEALGAVVELS